MCGAVVFILWEMCGAKYSDNLQFSTVLCLQPHTQLFSQFACLNPKQSVF
jgi:hypothetical protein